MKKRSIKPNGRMIAGLAFAVVCLTVIVAAPVARAELNENGAEALANGPGDTQGARFELRNVRDSERYDWLLRPNSNLRTVGEPKECGPTHDAPMQADCGASLGR